MQLFICTIIYFLIVGFCIFLIYKINLLREKIKTNTEKIEKLDNFAYKNLRELQFKSKIIVNLSKKYTQQKYSMITEMLSTWLLMFLPFKKLKSLLYLKNLYKKLNL